MGSDNIDKKTKIIADLERIIPDKIPPYSKRLLQEHVLRYQFVSKYIKGKTVLDVACGTGLNFKFIENKIGPSGKIIAIDYVKEMLEAAEKEMKSRQYKNIRLILGDAASMSFPNNYFDGIVYTLGLTAIPGHFEALKRCKKMLKPDGKIAVLDGKYSDIKYAKFIINSLLKVIRLEETWDSKKEVIKDLGKLFSITKSEKYFFDTIFILVGKKYRTHD